MRAATCEKLCSGSRVGLVELCHLPELACMCALTQLTERPAA
jgi:hypothetical protein